MAYFARRSSTPTALSLLVLALLALVGCGEAVAACDRFAATGGSDRAAGTEQAPYATPERLASALRPGQTGCLRGGTYADGDDPFILDVERGGSEGAPITLRSYPGEKARLRGIVTVRPAARHVVLADLAFEGDGTQNTIKIYAADVVVEDSDITNLSRGESCMILGSNSERGHGAIRTVVRRNVFHDCGSPENDNHDHGIYASHALDGEIVDNLFYNHSGYAIQFYPNSQRMRFAHNVIDGGRGSIRGGIVFGGDDDHVSSGNVVEQNVIANAVTYGITSSWDERRGSGNVARRNCISGARDDALDALVGFGAQDNVEAGDPFLDAGARDYRLKFGVCLPVVGYDTAALLRDRQIAPPPPAAKPRTAAGRVSCIRRGGRRLSRKRRAACVRARRRAARLRAA